MNTRMIPGLRSVKRNNEIQTEREFRQGAQKEAEETLSPLFSAISNKSLLKKEDKLKILVPAAGCFPSYKAFTKELITSFPQLKKIYYTLLDLKECCEDIEMFMDFFHKDETNNICQTKKNIESKIRFVLEDLESYLKNPEGDTKYDIIYFEHPVTSSVNQIMDLFSTKNIVSAFPFLINKMHRNSIIISTHYTREESWQMRQLLDFSLNCKLHTVSMPKHIYSICNIIFPYHFSNGVVTTKACTKNLFSSRLDWQRKSNKIIQSQKEQVWTLLSSFILYLVTRGKAFAFSENDVSMICFLVQVSLLNPDNKTKISKLTLLLIQMFLLIYSMNELG